MKRPAFVLALLVVGASVSGALAWRASILVEDQLFDFVARDGRFASVQRGPRPTGVPAALVQSIGPRLKAYAQSDAFRKRWAEHRAQYLPEPVARMATLAELRAREKADRDKTEAELQEQLKSVGNLPPDVQAQVRAGIEAARNAHRSMPRPTDQQLLEMEKARYESDQADYQRRMAEAPPADPKVALRQALKFALAETEGIDFNATTRRRPADGRLVFTSTEYEEKSYEWKMGYRAGRDATTAARAFAQAWLAELK